jgi:hypothetical protein
MEITKQLLLEKLEALRCGNNEALENEETSDDVYEQEEAIRDTFDMVERMLKELPDDEAEPEHCFNPITAKEVINHLKGYQPDAKIIALIWGESDVRGLNKDEDGNGELDEDFHGTPLTDDEVNRVLANLTHNHDACYGVSWDTISDTISMIKDN